MQILLVDDESGLLDQAKIFLERLAEEIEVSTASSAEKALDLLNENDFDVIVSDYQMPVKDGLEFLKEIREERDSDIPFIMFTGKGREEVAMEALNLGADRYLQKGGDPSAQYSVLAQAVEQEVKHHRTELDLEKSEKRYRKLVESTGDIIIKHDENGRVKFVNQAGLDFTGYSEEEVKGKNITDFLPEEEIPALIERKKKRIEEGDKNSFHFETCFINRDGKKIDVDVEATPLFEEGEYNGDLVIARDITNLKRSEENLKESEERYRRLFETAQDGMLIIDAETGIIEDANPFLQDILGYSKEELVGKELWELGTFKSIIENKKRFKKLVEEGYIRYEDEPLETKDGEEVSVEFVSNTYEAGGKRVVQCNIREISEREEYQEELKRKERYLDHTPEFINIIDEKGEIKYQSSPSHGIEGIDSSKVMGSQGIEYVHRDDREEIQEMFSKVLENSGEEYRTELRGETKEGWTWFEVRAINHLDDPEISGIIVTARDITKRKETKEELMKSERKFRNIFENLGDPVIIKKLGAEDDGTILDANRAMSDMLGYSSNELIGMNIYDDIVVQDPEELNWQEVKERLKEGNRTEFTVKKKRKDGSELEVEVVAVPMEYEGKDAVLAVNRDITEREKRKSELQERVKELDCLYTISNLTQKQDMTVETLLQEVVENIPPGFSYPEKTCAKITFDGKVFQSEGFKERSQSLSKEFSTEYGSGRLEVYVDRKATSEEVFLEREKELINSIAVNIENFIERRESQKELERIEWMLSKEQVASTAGKDSATYQDQGYGDLTDLNEDGMILQSLGRDLLNDIVSEYLDLLETSSAIYEKNGDYAFGIFSSGWCKFMDRQSRKLCDTEDNADALNSGKWLCHESCWTDCSKKAIATQEPVDIECKGGISLYAVPIFAGGEVIGAINFGYGTPPKDPEELHQLAEKYKVNYEDLVQKADRYNPRPDFIIEMAKNRLHASARLIGTLVERKQAKTKLDKSKKKIKELYEASSIISSIGDQEELYDEVIEIANRILDFDVCTIFIEDEGKLMVKASTKTELVDDFEMSLDQGIAGKTYRNNKSYLRQDITEDSDANPTDSELRSGITVPLGYIGVFQAESYEKGYYDEDDLEMAELLVSHIEEAIHRIRIEDQEEFLHSLLRHDVGNKNQIIQGYLELLDDHDLSGEVKEFVDKAERAAKDSIEMIRKVRNLRKIEEEEEIDEVDLSSVLDNVRTENQDQLQDREIDIDLAEYDYKVKGGPLLEELFSNLIGNSIKHSGCDEIKIYSQVEKDECVVTVEDDGSGISDELKDKIFKKGFKSGEYAGTGLGLYMVKEIADSYGGSVEVKDSELGGARFDVHLKKSEDLND